MSSLTFKTTTMAHQRAAVEKLSRVKVGALYMDMGTGKTRTALELAVRRLNAGKVNCILWCCPVSVKRTIADEIEKHVRGAVYEILQPDRIKNRTAHIYTAGIESLSSSIALNARLMELVESQRCFLVCDESSLIKNHHANRTLALWRLGERCQYKLILNGTPLSNNEKDLFSQWYFLDPRILGYMSFYSFAANHLEFDERYPGRVVRAHNVDYLTHKIGPYTYQIRKDECLDLPPKTYSSRYCWMTPEQREVYEITKSEILDIDPSRFESYIIYQVFTALQKVVSGIRPCGDPIFLDPFDNPRIQVLLETIEDLPQDSKTIIWCKYTHEIKTLKTVLEQKYGDVAVLHGGLSLRERDCEIERFRGPARFLVANKRVGAFGLNLQHCNYAIYYANDFSWETRSQSEDRIHRVGQTRNCHIIDIVCERSIDERIHESLQRKENLIDSFRREIARVKDRISLSKWLDVEEGEDGTDDTNRPGTTTEAGDRVRICREKRNREDVRVLAGGIPPAV